MSKSQTLTADQAKEVLDRYGIQYQSVENLLEDADQDEITGSMFTTGIQISDASCTVNNVCRGCP
jgi:hypothetical protein